AYKNTTVARKSLFLESKIAIYGLNEICRTAVSSVVIQGRPGGLHLFECHSPLDHVLNAIANDNDHVAILENISLIADSTVSGNDVRPAFLKILRHGDIEHLV